MATKMKPCANCGHAAVHGTVSGCVAPTNEDPKAPTTWCDCRKYVNPRDRKADRAAGVQAGRQGADAALHGYAMSYDADGWRDRADARLDELIGRGTDFTAEDVTDVVGPAPSPNAIGGLFLSRKADMASVGFVTASRPEARGRALRVWKAKA